MILKLSALYCIFPYLPLTVLNIQLYGLMQAAYNVIAYKDNPRLGTALELLRTTQEIENELQEVCHYLDCLFLNSVTWALLKNF